MIMKTYFYKPFLYMSVVLLALTYTMSAHAARVKDPVQLEEVVNKDSLIQQAKASVPEFIREFGEKYDCIEYKEDGKKSIHFEKIPFIKNHPLPKKYLLLLVMVAAAIFIPLYMVYTKIMDLSELVLLPRWSRMLLCTLFIILFLMEIIYFIFPNDGGHLLYFLFPSQVGWLMMFVDFFLMVGLIIGQPIAFGGSQFMLHKHLVPVFSSLAFIVLSILGMAVAYGFDIKIMQEHLLTVIGIFILLQTGIIIFYNIKERQPAQTIVEIPFFIIGLLSTTVFIGTALLIVGGIIIAIVLLMLLVAFLALITHPGEVISAITGNRVKKEKDNDCITCSYYIGGKCSRSTCIDRSTRIENGDE